MQNSTKKCLKKMKKNRKFSFFFPFLPVKSLLEKKRILRVAQKTQIRAALQELLEILPDRMWRETMRSVDRLLTNIQKN